MRRHLRVVGRGSPSHEPTASFRATRSSPASARGRSPISSTSFRRSPTRTSCSSTGRAARSSPMTCSGTPTSRSASASTRCSAAQRETSASRRARPASEQRLLFVDWPILERHKQALAPTVDRYIEVSDPGRPRSLTGDALRSTLHGSPAGPSARGRRSFPARGAGNGSVAALGIETDAPNLAWSYELITPESGILLGDDAAHRGGVRAADGAGRPAHPRGRRSPNASASRSRSGSTTSTRSKEGTCRSSAIRPPRTRARRSGSRYTQDETYYVMETTPGASVFLGLRDDVDLERSGPPPRAPNTASRSRPSAISRPMPPKSTGST